MPHSAFMNVEVQRLNAQVPIYGLAPVLCIAGFLLSWDMGGIRALPFMQISSSLLLGDGNGFPKLTFSTLSQEKFSFLWAPLYIIVWGA